MSSNAAQSGRSVTNKIKAILMTFSEGEERSVADISRITGIPASTAHRLVAELTALELLQRTDNAMYRVGVALRIIASTDASAPSIHERAPHILKDLSGVTNSRARLGVLQELRISYIEKLPGPRPVTEFDASPTLPAHPTAVGRAILAFSPSSVVELVIAKGLKPHTRSTTTSPERFRSALAVIRLTHVALTRSEFETDSSTVAMPVFGPGGDVAGALELAMNDLGHDLQRSLSALESASHSLTRELAAPMLPIQRFTPVARTAELQLTSILNALLARPTTDPPRGS